VCLRGPGGPLGLVAIEDHHSHRHGSTQGEDEPSYQHNSLHS
jgi:hypothetical protein